MIAQRDFKRGDLIIEEAPFYYSPKLEAYLEEGVSEKVKEMVFTFHTPDGQDDSFHEIVHNNVLPTGATDGEEQPDRVLYENITRYAGSKIMLCIRLEIPSLKIILHTSYDIHTSPLKIFTFL